MRTSPIQDSFQTGFIGRRIRGRTSVDAYKQGLAIAKNWYPLVQGPIKLRNGSKFMEAVDSDNWVSGEVGAEGLRCFTFQRAIDTDAIVEIGSDTISIRDSNTGDVIVAGGTGNLITDPDFLTLDGASSPVQSSFWSTIDGDHIAGVDPGSPQDDFCTGSIASVRYPDSVSLFWHLVNSDPDGFRGPSLGNTVNSIVHLPAGSELEINEFRFTYGQAIYGNEEEVLGPSPWTNPVVRVNIGTTKGADDVFTTDITIGPFQQELDVLINFVPGGGNNDLYFTIGVAWNGAVTTFPDLDTIGCDNMISGLPILDGVEWDAPLAGGSAAPAEFVSPYSADQLECIQFAMDPGEQVMYFMHPLVETHRLRFLNSEWTFEAISAITSPSVFVAPSPNNWNTDNFPSVGAIHEGRLWLGATPGQPATLWASRSGDYQDFDATGASSQDDPLDFALSASGNIQSITSRKELVINTDISEVIGTSQQGVIAFDDFSFPKQTDWGTNCVQPVVVGREMIFTSNSRQRLRTFADEGGTNFGWDGKELSLLAQDLFSSPVRRMVYLDEPSYQACFLLADGTMAMATYFYPENVIGWWRYVTAYNGNRTYGNEDDPGGLAQQDNVTQSTNQIMDITKVNTSNGAKLWMIVNRVGFAGTQKPGHELLAFDDPSGPPVALDSWNVRTPYDVNLDGTLRFDDCDELTGQSVNVVIRHVDVFTGNETFTVHPNVTVDAGVSTPLDDWVESGDTSYAGLFYDNEFELLPREGGSPRGTAMTSKRRWNKVFARLNNSAIPLINDEYPRDRTPATLMGTAEPFLSGDVEYIELGSDSQGQLNIKQDRPLQTEILALFGKLTSTEV